MATETLYDAEGNERIVEVPDEPANGPAQLRKALKKEQDEKLAAQAELAQLRAEKRSREIASALEAKGVKPAIAKFIPADADTSEAVEKWLADNAEIFGLQPATQLGENDPTRVSAAVEAARINGATENSIPATKQSDLLSQLSDPNLTKAALDAITGAGYHSPGRPQF